MTTESFERTKNSIWITSHCRMVAEKRYRTYDTVSNLLLSWLALSVLAWEVVKKSAPPNDFLDTYTALISVFVFAFSILTWGFRFGETSVLYRECYLKLQKLLDCEPEPDKMTCEYHEILGAHANHGDNDFDTLVIKRTLLTKREIRGGDGKNVEWTIAMAAKFAVRNIAFWLTTLAVFALGSYPYYVILTHI